MESLFDRATAVEALPVRTPAGPITLRQLHVRLGAATPDRLRPGTLAPSYTAKPLVSYAGAGMFGELAVLRWLERDGWTGVWADTAHERRFRRAMPHRAPPVPLPADVQRRYDAIVACNGGRASGCFDLIVWRADQLAFVEYLEPGAALGTAQRRWVGAAVRAGVAPGDLLVTSGDG